MVSKKEQRRRLHSQSIAIKNLCRRKRMASRRKSSNKLGKRFQEHYKSLRDPQSNKLPIYIDAPEMFIISEAKARTLFLGFLAKIKKFVLKDKCVVYINFKNTRMMSSDATLLLYAELTILNSLTDKRMVRYSFSKDRSCIPIHRSIESVIHQVLRHVGIFRVLGKHSKALAVHHTVKHWHSATGIDLDGEKLKPTADFYTGNVDTSLQSSKLYKALSEAMTNSVEHAYSDKKTERRWWVFSEERDGILTAVMCDLGIGIPASLTHGKWDPGFVRGILTRLGLVEKDCSLISAAFEVGKSKTGKDYRGKGLQQVRDVLDSRGKGTLRIFSARGFYEYEPGEKPSLMHDFDDSCGGTLITWRIPIPSEAHGQHPI